MWTLQLGVGYNYESRFTDHQMQIEGYAGRSFFGDLLEIGVGAKGSTNPFTPMLTVTAAGIGLLNPYLQKMQVKATQRNSYIGGYLGLNILRLARVDLPLRLIIAPTVGQAITKLDYIVKNKDEITNPKMNIRQLGYGVRLSFDALVHRNISTSINATYLHYEGSNSIAVVGTVSLHL